MRVHFTPPQVPYSTGAHHGLAAQRNADATTEAIAAVNETLSGNADFERIVLRAAAGAGKSFALKRIVQESLTHPRCSRVGVSAFANKQLFPLAEDLGEQLGQNAVCLYVSKDRIADVSDSTKTAATVVSSMGDVPTDAQVLICTSHMFGNTGWRLLKQMGPAQCGDSLFDVLLVDEAWQLPLHRYGAIERLASLTVGVGDVGQLPPIDPSANPWRGDRGYNPYRAWPTAYEDDSKTLAIELPSVWRPTGEQLPLWRAFYGDWESLDCVAAPGDRSLDVEGLTGAAADVWAQVGSGVPALVEVSDLDDAEAPDIDPPLLAVVESWLDSLIESGFDLLTTRYDDNGSPESIAHSSVSSSEGDALIAVLATRNQAVDDAQEMVDRLSAKHGLPEGVVVASTVDSWQGQTNAVTVAVHPLSGASQLDEFNSAFGRLAVTCTRATHGLLLVARSGLDALLSAAPPRPGTPFGEPGTRQLPRQTHQRILETFARGTYRA